MNKTHTTRLFYADSSFLDKLKQTRYSHTGEITWINFKKINAIGKTVVWCRSHKVDITVLNTFSAKHFYPIQNPQLTFCSHLFFFLFLVLIIIFLWIPVMCLPAVCPSRVFSFTGPLKPLMHMHICTHTCTHTHTCQHWAVCAHCWASTLTDSGGSSSYS